MLICLHCRTLFDKTAVCRGEVCCGMGVPVVGAFSRGVVEGGGVSARRRVDVPVAYMSVGVAVERREVAELGGVDAKSTDTVLCAAMIVAGVVVAIGFGMERGCGRQLTRISASRTSSPNLVVMDYLLQQNSLWNPAIKSIRRVSDRAKLFDRSTVATIRCRSLVQD